MHCGWFYYARSFIYTFLNIHFGLTIDYGSTLIVLKNSIGSKPRDGWLFVETCFIWLKMGIGSSLIWVTISIRSHSRGWRKDNWFLKSWFMSIFLSEKLYFIFSKYSFLNEKGFENTLIELKINIESNSRGQRENSLFLKGWILAATSFI